jgi:hypothetical protein
VPESEELEVPEPEELEVPEPEPRAGAGEPDSELGLGTDPESGSDPQGEGEVDRFLLAQEFSRLLEDGGLDGS